MKPWKAIRKAKLADHTIKLSRVDFSYNKDGEGAITIGGRDIKTLDPENETLIQQAIARLIEGKTVIIIAHRLRTIAEADKILVLEEGRSVEEGRHDDLMRKNGLYHLLYTIQQESVGWTVNA